MNFRLRLQAVLAIWAFIGLLAISPREVQNVAAHIAGAIGGVLMVVAAALTIKVLFLRWKRSRHGRR